MLRKFFCLIFLFVAVVVLLPRYGDAQTFSGSALYTFSSTTLEDPNGLVQGPDGNFYGTTYAGGNLSQCYSNGCGTVFRLTPQGALTTLYSFCSVGGSACTDGTHPSGGLIVGNDGNLWGTTSGSTGNVFTISPATGAINVYPVSGGLAGSLIQGTDGNFYGATTAGGAQSLGDVFVMTPSGAITILYSFCRVVDGGLCIDGYSPAGGLVQGSNGSLYGVTAQGGANSAGTAYNITTSGTFTSLYSFCGIDEDVCVDGQEPLNGMVEGADGNFYGSTRVGGVGGNQGIIFALTPTGNLTTLYSFTSETQVQSALLAEAGGIFYGISLPNTFFQVSSSGSYAIDYGFCSGTQCAGYLPNSLAVGGDGNFYGTNQYGGGPSCTTNNCGTVYQISASPALPAPVQLSLASSTLPLGDSVTLNWQVLNAFSDTMQQCNAFVQNNATGAGTWTGLQPGTMAEGVYSGSATIQPTAVGTYTYALTCGGIESGFATLDVADLPVPSTTTLTTNSPVITGSLVSLSASVAVTQNFGPVTGSVAFSLNSTSLGSVMLQNGSASLNLESYGLAIGTYPVTATYSGNTDYQTSSMTTNLLIVGNPTTTTLSLSSNTVPPGQDLVLSSTVSRNGSSAVPAGTVSFYAGTLLLGSASLSNGAAMLTLSSVTVPPAVYAVTAVYSGDSMDAASVSTPSSLTVTANTNTLLAIHPMSVGPGQNTTLTGTVQRAGQSGTPTGYVYFYTGSQYLGSAQLVGGKGSLTLTNNGSLPVGTISIVAEYSGDTLDQPSNSAAGSLTVDPPGYATVTSLNLMPFSVVQGQNLRLSSIVTRSGGSGSPSGTVNFYENGTSFADARLANGAATLRFPTNGSVPAGTYSLTATYTGDSMDQPSTSSPVTLTVLSATATTLQISPNPAPMDTAISLTATVRQRFGTGVPTGTVMLTAGGVNVGSAMLAAGTATVNLTDYGIPPGTYPVTVTYSGDSADGGSKTTVNLVIR